MRNEVGPSHPEPKSTEFTTAKSTYPGDRIKHAPAETRQEAVRLVRVGPEVFPGTLPIRLAQVLRLPEVHSERAREARRHVKALCRRHRPRAGRVDHDPRALVPGQRVVELLQTRYQDRALLRRPELGPVHHAVPEDPNEREAVLDALRYDTAAAGVARGVHRDAAEEVGVGERRDHVVLAQRALPPAAANTGREPWIWSRWNPTP